MSLPKKKAPKKRHPPKQNAPQRKVAMPIELGPLEEAMLERLHQLGLETDLGFMIELVDTYVSSFEKKFQLLVEACSARDAHNVHQAAHSLKGASLTIGAMEFGALCRKVEESAFEDATDSIAMMIPTLRKENHHVLDALQTVKTRLTELKAQSGG